ncbi:transglycosylase SLT domain-containing protein [Thiosulfatihalobacter marinus]|uniref:transglycosylase SLT domain-containing protein n=1 Tax=Thiosulfatihalobacter marinus TaxID=2792481 RepID=UPI0018D8C3E5|nr:transglycosylase SLT domain-containing protein [Thiosulfatihalobacter marinus]
MSRSLRTLMFMLLVAVAACSGRDRAPPRNLDNACSILKEKKHFKRAFKATERRWGVPVNVQMAILYQESKFISNARTPNKYVLGVLPMGRQSSAYGYAQVLDATWDQYKRETRNRGARRTNIKDASDFMGWYMNETRRRNGVALSNARGQYLAYHEGQSGYARGTYRKKSWLLRVADEVDARADRYGAQLKKCSRVW